MEDGKPSIARRCDNGILEDCLGPHCNGVGTVIEIGAYAEGVDVIYGRREARLDDGVFAAACEGGSSECKGTYSRGKQMETLLQNISTY